MPPRPGVHRGGSGGSSGWLRRLMVLISIGFAFLYFAFFLASSRHALQAAAREQDLHHPKGGLIQSLAAQMQQQQMQQLEEVLLRKEAEHEQAEAERAKQQPPKQQQQEPKQRERASSEDEAAATAAAAAKPEQQPSKPEPEPPKPTEPPIPPAKKQQPQSKQDQAPQVPLGEGQLSCRQGKKTYKQHDPGSIVYWRKWSEATPVWRSPYAVADEAAGAEHKYVTFEPDEGGFNNIRMALETFFVFALATGRTLVLPDEYNMYLLGKQGKLHDFSDFFDMEVVRQHVQVIQMSEFLEREGLTGQLKDGERPPGNATTFERKRPLWEYIRRATDVFPVGPSHVVGFEYDVGVGFDAGKDEAYQVFSAGRPLFVYGPELHAKRSLHFTSMMDRGERYLIHFYAFIYMRDPTADRFLKRFVRDAFHYRQDIIYCPAQKVVDLLHADGGGAAPDAAYDAIHIRRGDFQFKNTRLEVEEIFKNVEDVIAPGRLVYVLTDERNTSFFDPVRAKYRLRFLKDFQWTLDEDNVNPNLSGMIEQVIGSGAENFVGTYFSTLTGYITRLRGYLGKNPGYYFNLEYKNELQDPEANLYARSPFYMREWPVAYQGIDDAAAEEEGGGRVEEEKL